MDKEKQREYYKAYYEKNKEAIKNKERGKSAAGYAKRILQKLRHPDEHIFTSARTRAKVKGMEFSIGIEDVIIPEYCPYLGVKINTNYTEGKPDEAPSLDRIDSSKDYIKGNVQVISWKANWMKNNATEEQLIAFAKGILRVHAGIDVDKIPPSEG